MSPAPSASGENDPNMPVYNAPQVVAHYSTLDYLSPAERLLFDKYLHRGDSILDLGVGGGRTTPYLASIASRYVGADYAAEMIVVCQRKFPNVPFVVADATRLSMFEDGTFDAVVMAFNGFDYVLGDESRKAALGEIRRVLKTGGLFLFSAHNPRAIWSRPSWNQKRIDVLAARVAGESGPFFAVVRVMGGTVRAALAWLQSSVTAVRALSRRIARQAFWRGEGYMVDSAHGGLLTHYAVPDRIKAEVEAGGFQLLEILGDDCPARSGNWITSWYYYVFAKNAGTK